MKHPLKTGKNPYAAAGSVLFWIGLWQAASMAVHNPLLLPSVPAVLLRLWELAGQLSYWKAVGMSLSRILLGILGGVVSGLRRGFGMLFEPFLGVLRAAPVASFIVLLILWLNRDYVPGIVAALTVLPLVWAGAEEGTVQVDPDLKAVAQVYAMPLSRQIRCLYFPSLMPYLAAALESSLGLGWKSAVAAEVITLPMVSIGRRLYSASNNLDTAGTFAWTVTVVLLSLLMGRLVKHFTGAVGKRSTAEKQQKASENEGGTS